MKIRIKLSAQESEFALACKDLVAERDLNASEAIEVTGGELVVLNEDRVREAFVTYGLARLMKVFHLAINKRAMPLAEVPRLIANLAAFHEKVVTALVLSSKDTLQ